MTDSQGSSNERACCHCKLSIRDHDRVYTNGLLERHAVEVCITRLRDEVERLQQRTGHEPAPALGKLEAFNICIAYESGFGHGAKGDGLPNPYKQGTEAYEAYFIGYSAGQEAKRGASQPPSAPQSAVDLIADDAYAATFQSMAQYRRALLSALRATPPPPAELLEASQRVGAIALGAAGKHAERVVELEAEVSTLREHLAEQNRLLSLNVAEVERLRAAQPAAAQPNELIDALNSAVAKACGHVAQMKAVLDDLEESFDKEIHPEQVKEDFDAPDDREYTVTITAKQWRALGRALSDAPSVTKEESR